MHACCVICLLKQNRKKYWLTQISLNIDIFFRDDADFNVYKSVKLQFPTTTYNFGDQDTKTVADIISLNV